MWLTTLAGQKVPSPFFQNHARSKALTVIAKHQCACGMPPCGGRAASLNRLKPQMSRTRPDQQLWKTPRGWGVTGHGAAGVLSLNAPHANYAAAGDEFANQDGDAAVCQLTHAHSKKIENHRQALELYFIYDNLARIHSTLRRHCAHPLAPEPCAKDSSPDRSAARCAAVHGIMVLASRPISSAISRKVLP